MMVTAYKEAVKTMVPNVEVEVITSKILRTLYEFVVVYRKIRFTDNDRYFANVVTIIPFSLICLWYHLIRVNYHRNWFHMSKPTGATSAAKLESAMNKV